MRLREIPPLPLCLAAALLAGCDCGQTRLIVPPPQIVVTPAALDFGNVLVPGNATMPIQVSNIGRGPLVISSVTLETADDISLPSTLLVDCMDARRTTPNPLELDHAECALISVRFDATKVETIANAVIIKSNDPNTPTVKVPIAAHGVYTPPPPPPQIEVCVLDTSGNPVASQCTDLPTAPHTIPTLAFGTVSDGTTVVRKLRVSNVGGSPLTISSEKMQTTSADLSLLSPPTPPTVLAPAATMNLDVEFAPRGSGAITGDVLIQSNSTIGPSVAIPITATEMQSMCTSPTVHLGATVGSSAVPASGVLAMTNVTITETSSGGSSAAASETWTLVSSPTGSTSTIVGTGTKVTLDCTTAGTYVVGVVVKDTDGCESAQEDISIVVTGLPPVCGAATEFIYTVDESGVLYKFVPSTATLTSLGNIHCPSISTVNTMGVDRTGIAWVEYEDGELFRVDTTTVTCYSTAFNPSEVSDDAWGSCFAIDAVGGSTDTYFIAEDSQLATINTTTLAVSIVGPLTGSAGTQTDEPELTGTESALLYGFFPDNNGFTLNQIDRTTGTLTTSTPLPIIGQDVAVPGNWAFAAWQTDFWFFVGDGTSTDIFHYSGATQTTSLALKTQAIIVGAGVSPCVQMQ